MYKVWIDGTLVLDPPAGLILGEPRLTLEDNESGECAFTLYDDSPAFGAVKLLKSRVLVARDDKIIYEGRVIEAEKRNSYSLSVKTEGALAYLADSIQRPAEYHNLSVAGYFQQLIAIHNQQVSADKQFLIGDIQITDPNDSLYRYTNWESTLDVIQSDLISTLGGHLRVRYENGKRYLDCLAEGGPVASQKIEFGENLLELCQTTDASDLATVCIPLGAKIDSEGNDPQALERYLTIESVNDGKDYLEISNAIAAYGRVTKTVEFDKVTDPANLKTKGQKWLTDSQYETLEISVSAVDLADLGVKNAEPWNLYDRIPCYCPAMGLDRTFLLTKKEIHLVEISKNRYTLGAAGPNFTSQTKSRGIFLEKRISGALTTQNLDGAISNLHYSPSSFVSKLPTSQNVVSTINESGQIINAGNVDAEGIRKLPQTLVWTAVSSSLTEAGKLSAASPAFTGTVDLGGCASLDITPTGEITIDSQRMQILGPLVTSSGARAIDANVVIPGFGQLSFENGLLTRVTPEEGDK